MAGKSFKYVAGISSTGKPILLSVNKGTGKGECASKGFCSEHPTVEQWNSKVNVSVFSDFKEEAVAPVTLTQVEASVEEDSYSDNYYAPANNVNYGAEDFKKETRVEKIARRFQEKATSKKVDSMIKFADKRRNLINSFSDSAKVNSLRTAIN